MRIECCLPPKHAGTRRVHLSDERAFAGMHGLPPRRSRLLETCNRRPPDSESACETPHSVVHAGTTETTSFVKEGLRPRFSKRRARLLTDLLAIDLAAPKRRQR
jgi:hypothetical protein